MSKVLDEREIVRLMREEWARRKEKMLSEITIELGEKPIIGPGLKIVDKDGNLFTVISVGVSGTVLEDPGTARVLVPWEELEKEYRLQ